MVTLPLLAAIETLLLGKVKVLCFGDFDQLPCINNSWRGQSVDSRVFQHSRLMKSWCDCTIFRMTGVNFRRCDKAHFDYYCQIPAMDLGTAVAEARTRYPSTPTHADWNLTISHHRRMQLNANLQEAATRAYKASGGTSIVRIDPEEEDEEETARKKRRICKNRAQAYDLWPGTRLIGATSETKHIVNGALLDVMAVSNDEEIKVTLKDIETNVEFTLTPEQVAKHTRLRWAVTYPAIQGRTLDGTVRLWDADSKHFTIEALYVGLSRAKDGSKVSVV